MLLLLVVVYRKPVHHGETRTAVKTVLTRTKVDMRVEDGFGFAAALVDRICNYPIIAVLVRSHGDAVVAAFSEVVRQLDLDDAHYELDVRGFQIV